MLLRNSSHIIFFLYVNNIIDLVQQIPTNSLKVRINRVCLTKKNSILVLKTTKHQLRTFLVETLYFIDQVFHSLWSDKTAYKVNFDHANHFFQVVFKWL